MNEHLPPLEQLRAACVGIRQRAIGPAYFVGRYRETGDRHELAAAEHHARNLRARCELAHAELEPRLRASTTTNGGDDARRMG